MTDETHEPPTFDEALEIFGKIEINQITICEDITDSTKPIGSVWTRITVLENILKSLGLLSNFYFFRIGLYLEASVIDHSCISNAITTFTKNKELVIRTIQNVDCFSKIRISYFSNIWETTQNRREYLQSNYYFYCECPNCIDEMADFLKSSLKCDKCDGCVPRCTRICVDCKNEFFPQDILEKYDVLKNKITEIVPYGAYPNKGWSILLQRKIIIH